MSDTPVSKTSHQKDLWESRGMSLIYFLGRAQKIASAIYLVTGLLKDTEPLRGELRKRAVRLLSYIRGLSDNNVANEHVVLDVKKILEHTLALSGLASQSGLVSSMNHEFIAAEIESFVNDLSSAFKDKNNAPSIAGSLKDADRSISSALLLSSGSRGYKGHYKGQPKGHVISQIKKTQRQIFGDFKQMVGPIKDIVPASAGGAERKEKIYQIIQEKGSLTIKDIALVAPQYSEKTIQRDLVEMVGNGRVKKKGERRWTVYFV